MGAAAAAAVEDPDTAMLHADKANLESTFRLRMIHIREKELSYFVRNCQNLG